MRRIVRACRCCNTLKPEHKFGTGRERHVCNDCAKDEQRQWTPVGAQVMGVYTYIQATKLRRP